MLHGCIYTLWYLFFVGAWFIYWYKLLSCTSILLQYRAYTAIKMCKTFNMSWLYVTNKNSGWCMLYFLHIIYYPSVQICVHSITVLCHDVSKSFFICCSVLEGVSQQELSRLSCLDVCPSVWANGISFVIKMRILLIVLRKITHIDWWTYCDEKWTLIKYL